MERYPRASSEQLRNSLRLRLEARRAASSRPAESDSQPGVSSEVAAREMGARPRDA
jgi:hypothetical protein